PEPPVEDDPLHPLVAELPELETHLVGIELTFQEPERKDPVVTGRFPERVEIERSWAHGVTVAFTKPGGFSTAVRNALSIRSSGKRSVTSPAIDSRREVSSRMPRRIPRRIVATSRKYAFTIRNAIQFHAASSIVRGGPWWYPTVATVPRLRVTCPRRSRPGCTPVTSKATSAPRSPVTSATASTSERSCTFTVCVAPSEAARSSASPRASG